MLIDLTQIPSKVISLDDAFLRKTTCTKELEELNIKFSFFEGVRFDPGWIGCGLSHCRLLREISEIDGPYAIYEDDIIRNSGNTIDLENKKVIVDDLSTKIEVPDDADALYLGNSIYGYVNKSVALPWTVLTSTSFDKTNSYPRITKVLNMCAAHAIVYISERYKKDCRDLMADLLAKRIPIDIATSGLHRHYNVYTLKRPMFIQAGQVQATNIEFTEKYERFLL